MENSVFGSIEDIDAALEKEFVEVANETDESEEEVTNEDNTIDESSEVAETEEPIKEPTEVVEEPQREVDKSDEKRDYAFANLRSENSNLKKERDSYKEDSEYLKELAASYGYTNIQDFQNAINEARYKKEADARGYDYELYKKTMEQEARIAQLEKERDMKSKEIQMDRLKNAIDVAMKEYGVDNNEVFSRLEKSGVTVDEILSIKNPKLIIDGVFLDKVKSDAKQTQINEINNMKGLVEDKNEGNGKVKPITIEDLLKEDLKQYKEENFY